MKFTIPLAQVAAKANADIEAVIQQVTGQLFRSVVLKTPVDTGRARANWNVSQGTPDASTTQSVDQARGFAQAAQAATLKAGKVTYLTNGLPYIRRLEHGYSKQAPAGMVKVSAVELDNHIKAAIQEKA